MTLGAKRSVPCPRVDPVSPWIVSQSTGLLVPPSCRSWRCGVCGPVRSQRLARALDAAGYDRVVTVTKAPRDYRQGMARLAHLLRAEGPWEWCWTIERGRRTGMVHAHAVCRGGWRENRKGHGTVQDRAHAAGWGWCWVQQPQGHAGRYAAKFGRYAAKGSDDYETWLGWNGGKRPWHWSRRYTGGVPMRKWVPEHAPARDPGPWVLVPAHRLIDVLAEREAQGAIREGYAAQIAPFLRERAREVNDALDWKRALELTFDAQDAAQDAGRSLAARARRGDAFAGYRTAERARRLKADREAVYGRRSDEGR